MKKIILILITGLFAFTATNAQGKDNKPPVVNSPKTEVIHLTKAEFLKLVVDYEKNPNTWNYLGNKPAIVDFYADWCGPCKIISPILDELSKEYKGKIIVYKVNTDKEQDLANAFKIQSIPTLVFIPLKGNPQVTLGAQTKVDLKKTIDEFLLKSKAK